MSHGPCSLTRVIAASLWPSQFRWRVCTNKNRRAKRAMHVCLLSSTVYYAHIPSAATSQAVTVMVLELHGVELHAQNPACVSLVRPLPVHACLFGLAILVPVKASQSVDVWQAATSSLPVRRSSVSACSPATRLLWVAAGSPSCCRCPHVQGRGWQSSAQGGAREQRPRGLPDGKHKHKPPVALSHGGPPSAARPPVTAAQTRAARASHESKTDNFCNLNVAADLGPVQQRSYLGFHASWHRLVLRPLR